MAEWKKVAVSGSNISQFNNDANYLTSITAQNAFATASYDGTELLAGGANGNLTFESSSNQGLTISADAGTDTLTFGLSDIPNSSLANSTISGKSLGSNLDALTVDNATIQLDSGTTFDGSSARTISVKDGGIDADALAAGVAGTGLSGGAGSALSVDYGATSGTAVQGNTTITLTQTAGEIDITGTGAQALGGAPSYTIGLADTISGNRTFSGDTITFNNDVVVQGTASFQNTENLLVADRFVLFASGSGTAGDGGIVVQQDTQDVGELFGYDSNTSRWGVTGSFSADSSAYTPDAFMSAVTTLASTNPNTSGPDAKYDKVGNIYVSATDESIWIYA